MRTFVWISVLAATTVPAMAPSLRAQPELKAYYKDDFILEDAGKNFQLKIRGNMHLDARAYQCEGECGDRKSVV